MTLVAFYSRTHSRLWWEAYLQRHPGKWIDAEGGLMIRVNPEGWVVPEELN